MQGNTRIIYRDPNSGKLLGLPGVNFDHHRIVYLDPLGEKLGRQYKHIESYIRNYYQREDIPSYPNNILFGNTDHFILRAVKNIYWHFLSLNQSDLNMPEYELLNKVQALDLKACYLATKLEYLYSDIWDAEANCGDIQKQQFYQGLLQRIEDTCKGKLVSYRTNGNCMTFEKLPSREVLLNCFQAVHNDFYSRTNLRNNQGRSLLRNLLITPISIFFIFSGERRLFQSFRKSLAFAYMSKNDQQVEKIKCHFEEFDCYRKVQRAMPPPQVTVQPADQEAAQPVQQHLLQFSRSLQKEEQETSKSAVVASATSRPI